MEKCDTIEPPHDKTNKVACAPSEDADQPGHPPSLIRVFTVRLMGSLGPRLSSSGQRRLLIRLGGCPGWSVFAGRTGHFVGFVMRRLNLWVSASIIKIGPRQENLVLIAYASSEGSGEPAHPRSLARTSSARSYKQWVKRNLQTENQIPGPSELLGMHSSKFVMTECSKTQIRLTRHNWKIGTPTKLLLLSKHFT